MGFVVCETHQSNELACMKTLCNDNVNCQQVASYSIVDKNNTWWCTFTSFHYPFKYEFNLSHKWTELWLSSCDLKHLYWFLIYKNKDNSKCLIQTLPKDLIIRILHLLGKQSIITPCIKIPAKIVSTSNLTLCFTI